MMNTKEFALGIDFGTLSARAVLVKLSGGGIVAQAERAYAHGVITALPAGRGLPRGWALQNPNDYMDALLDVVPRVLRESGADPLAIAGIGVDFTCSTPLPVLKDGTPLCALPAFQNEPNAYAKLWKHHAADQAARITATAREMKLKWLQNSGGKVSAEWLLPKLLQMVEEAPEAFEQTDAYLEAGDWIVSMLVGNLVRSESFAAYKNFFLDGYPRDEFFSAVHPAFHGLSGGRLRGAVLPISGRAGLLTREMAARLTLAPGTPIAPALTDAHAGVPAAGLCGSGDMLSILGTSACHILQHERDIPALGIAGKARNGIIDGLTSYEANQSMGELFEWFTQSACPEKLRRDAAEKNIDAQTLLASRAQALRAGESGLLALDWLGGNRCVLADPLLSGLIVGLTLRTKPEEIYRALLESTAYAMREITDNYEAQGLNIGRIVALGGVARKSPLLMQIIVDTLNREIAVSSAKEGAALGAAIYGAAAGGAFKDVRAAAAAMAQPIEKTYRPGPDAAVYRQLFHEYHVLHDYFGRGGNPVMHTLALLAEETK